MRNFFKKTVFNLAQESKCVSRQVGAVIVRNNRIIATGYNGTIAGAKNCCEVFDKENFEREDHVKWSKANELHAEQNALIMAARYGIEVEGADVYSSLQPCSLCLIMMAQAGIKNIYYFEDYDRPGYDQEMIDDIRELGTNLIKLN